MPKPQIKMGTAITNYHQVRFAPNAMLSSHATVCGNVTIGAGTSVFAGTQIRGDCEPIVIGSNTNIQENSCLHVSMGSKLTIGDSVTIGHNAVLHGCTIGHVRDVRALHALQRLFDSGPFARMCEYTTRMRD